MKQYFLSLIIVIGWSTGVLANSDEQMRSMLVGRWTQYATADQVLRNYMDLTRAPIDVRYHFYSDGRITFGGEAVLESTHWQVAGTQLSVSQNGRSSNYQIVEIDQQKMVLRNDFGIYLYLRRE